MVHLSAEELWLERQYRIEQKLKAYSEEAFSFLEPKVVLNPYEIAPLTAFIFFHTPTNTAITLTVFDQNGEIEMQHQFPEAEKHCIPVYGLHPAWNNKILLQQNDGQVCQLNIMTGPLPETLKTAQVTGVMEKGAWMFTVPLPGQSYPAAYDFNGICRWFLTEEVAFKFTRAKNGRILTCGPALLSPPYSPTSLWEMDLTGKIHREYRVPGGVYNDFFEMENGNLLLLNQRFEHGTTEDLCVYMDRETGEILRVWDIRKLLPMDQAGSPSQKATDWFHASSVWYDAKTDSITIAGKYQDIIINIDFVSGALNWMIGNSDGWPAHLVEPYFFKPAESSFQWCYEMESASILPDGTLLCFDNGAMRCKKGQEPLPLQERYSKAVQYQLDFSSRQITEIWSYGKERGKAFYSPYMGRCTAYGEGQYLIQAGGIGQLNGESVEPAAFFAQATTPQVQMKTCIVELKQDAEVLELLLPCNCYYAEKISFNQLNMQVSFEAGKIIGERLGSSVFEMGLEWEDAGQLDASYQISAKLTREQLLVSGCFQKGEMVMLLLEGEETIPYYVQTTKEPYLTMDKNSFVTTSDRPLTYAVSLQNISGTYEICIGIDDKKYHTAIWFHC